MGGGTGLLFVAIIVMALERSPPQKVHPPQLGFGRHAVQVVSVFLLRKCGGFFDVYDSDNHQQVYVCCHQTKDCNEKEDGYHMLPLN
ncbi:unnamed protein product [Larinioides sclopetarius]|uniref:Uncharacterized protein n=1 Tax=Larinioides sclopetarius TaxID=280406 RepID=A0AAV2B357_9ARAC